MKFGSLSIGQRTALLSWTVTISTLGIFVGVIVPWQKRTFLNNLESKAHSVALSLREVTAGAAVNEDYSSVIEHCKEMIKGDQSLTYLVITKNDGFTLVHDRRGWRAVHDIAPEWRPLRREASGGIRYVPLLDQRAFHYSQPFDYSGLEWGWIHVGLSLDSYEQSVASLYRLTGELGVVCILLSLIASLVYARKLVRPILDLRSTVQRVADGDLSATAGTNRHDELGELATSVNGMTAALVRHDMILGSVQFAAQHFLSTGQWRTVIGDILARIGSSAGVCRAYVLEISATAPGETPVVLYEHEWRAPHIPPRVYPADQPPWPDFKTDTSGWTACFRQGGHVAVQVGALTAAERQLIGTHPVQSLMMIPVMVEGAWWGLLGLDDCKQARRWRDAERDSLQAAAAMLGSAVARQRAQDALLEAKANLEHRVQERTRALQQENLERREAEAKLSYERDLLQTLMDGLPDTLYFKDRESRFVRISRSKAESALRLFRKQHDANGGGAWPEHLTSVEAMRAWLLGRTDHDVYSPEFAAECLAEEQAILRTGQPIQGKVETFANAEGGATWNLVTKMPWRDSQGRTIGTYGITKDITVIKEAEIKLATVHDQLMRASRQAGMAEVATGVLHNVGNVLNSVNVSATLLRETVRTSEVATLKRVAGLLRNRSADLGNFLTTDPKGQLIPGFVIQLADQLAQEHAVLSREHEHLARNVEHIKEIVSMQQSYAKVSGVLEKVRLADLVSDALQLQMVALTRDGIEVTRDYAEIPPALIDKHKVLQILVNLIHNARHALAESGRPDRRIVFRIRPVGAARFQIVVADNGVGIPPENMTLIFSHGFTTRADGHGFGLHSGAIAAHEMGGSIHAASDGPGQGATFTLELPLTLQNQNP